MGQLWVHISARIRHSKINECSHLNENCLAAKLELPHDQEITNRELKVQSNPKSCIKTSLLSHSHRNSMMLSSYPKLLALSLVAAFVSLRLVSARAISDIEILEARQNGSDFHWVDTWVSMPQLVESSNLPPSPFVSEFSTAYRAITYPCIFVGLRQRHVQRCFGSPNASLVNWRRQVPHRDLQHLRRQRFVNYSCKHRAPNRWKGRRERNPRNACPNHLL